MKMTYPYTIEILDTFCVDARGGFVYLCKHIKELNMFRGNYVFFTDGYNCDMLIMHNDIRLNNVDAYIIERL